MLWTILIILAFIIFFTVGLIPMIILLIVRLFDKNLAARIGQPIVCKFGWNLVLGMAGCRKDVKGLENIPEGPCLFVGNHRSFFDIPLSYSVIPAGHLTAYVSKKEVGKVPFLNCWMVILNCIFLDRSNPKAGLKGIKQAIAEIEAGRSVMILPEGTRNKGEGVSEFHGGSFKIAERTGCPVVPVAMAYTDDVFEKHMPIIKPQRMKIIFGKPIETKGLSRDELRNIPGQAHEEVLKMYEGLMAE